MFHACLNVVILFSAYVIIVQTLYRTFDFPTHPSKITKNHHNLFF